MAKQSATNGTRSSGRGRTRRKLAVRRQSYSPAAITGLLMRSPEIGWALLIGAVFVTFATAIMSWSSTQPLHAPNQPARETILARVDVEIVDDSRTAFEREAARRSVPRVYTPDEALMRQALATLRALPAIVGDADSLDDVSRDDRRRFAIDEQGFGLLASAVGPDGQPSDAWSSWVVEFGQLLRRHPLLDGETTLRQSRSTSDLVQLALLEGPTRVAATSIINRDDAEAMAASISSLAARSRFPETVRPSIVAIMRSLDGPTFRFDAESTSRLADTAEANVAPVITRTPSGSVIFRRGEPVTQTQIDLFQEEMERFHAEGPAQARWLRLGGLLACAAAVAAGTIGYIALYSPRVARNPQRMAALGGLMLIGLGVSAAGVVSGPDLRALALLAPPVFVAALIAIAYEGRLALTMGSMVALLIAAALREPAPVLVAMVTGVAVAAWQLSELRERRSLIRAGVAIGLSLAAAFVGASVVSRAPNASPRWDLIAINGMWAAFAGVLVMGLTLFILPTIERAFDITTGMTLIELRDPKQPLLRELQRRAPGTYNHSLNVASISEQAAEAIGADSLLTYAGVLYHDIGKMNKPEYFVENQSGGPNKHDKLSPAMSLLVIVGHVKDGLELAREFGLPRRLHHFIEAHHGTTLVEYFYERARKAAAEQEEQSGRADVVPEEVEYRYPGPKPQTKEVAIVMVADAVESATRTMPEPTPSRIESLVHSIARKRLEDGQFDECGLTLKELHTITESIAKSVTSIYHGRIAYPGAAAAR
ncbi:MAG: HDIG domain-containing metalloprotein [Planctomycetota bacterium]